ncbi:cell growth-regulating nucleolar protein [Melanaphis sacchari]|uniref:cell growth-regulating nucleolar protein n=1 Tax=Melanaphis sacchari TaxID=742174 RepID=UPI000DC150F4|nr:cell growth-regulating nucleolar protein [Melanaphis sacchari]
MVVFTCNNCGDSVNKPKVDKHIQYECKRKNFAVSFCCVDCLKDFNYETVRDHCQCITEDERYSAKGYVPKPSAEKGKRKQAGWVDIVQSVLNNKNLPNEQRQFLNVIAKFDNVPRKKNKFQNFCFSTAPAYRNKGYLVDQVFDVIEAEYKAQLPQNSNEKPVDNTTKDIEKNDSTQKESQEIKKKMNIENDKIVTSLNGSNETEEPPKKKKKKNKQSLDTENYETETKLKENVEPLTQNKKNSFQNNSVAEKKSDVKDTNITETKSSPTKKPKKNKKNDSIQEVQEIKDNKIINSETIEQLNGNCKSEETPKKKKKSKKSLDAVNYETEIIAEKNVEPQLAEAQPSSSKKSKKNKNKSEIELNNDPTHSIVSKTNEICENNVENGILQEKSEIQMSKKEKKEMKKKIKYQQELATVSNGIVESNKEPVLKKKKRKLNDNEETEEPQQKILKTDISQVPEVQSGRKFDWNEAINQVLQTKKNKPMSLSKVMKRVMCEFHSLNQTNKSENDLEKIFLKKIRKMKNVTIENDKVLLVGC